MFISKPSPLIPTIYDGSKKSVKVFGLKNIPTPIAKVTISCHLKFPPTKLQAESIIINTTKERPIRPCKNIIISHIVLTAGFALSPQPSIAKALLKSKEATKTVTIKKKNALAINFFISVDKKQYRLFSSFFLEKFNNKLCKAILQENKNNQVIPRGIEPLLSG